MGFTFVIGGARSGKSAYAQGQAEAAAARLGSRPVMIATGEALDDEMAARIARHQVGRGAAWRTVEAPLDLPAAVQALAPGEAAAVDCLTLWLSNLLHADRPIDRSTDDLLRSLSLTPAEVVVVANEVGLGIVPENALARRFRDEAGRMNQAMAAASGRAVLVVAGLPLVLKG